MEYKPSGLFQLVAQGDDVKLQRLLLEAKEERNVATLAVSLPMEISNILINIFLLVIAWEHGSSRGCVEWIQ